MCTATLEVVDEHPPEAETELIEIWPPNHKMVDVSLDECIVDIYDCDDDDVDARILWVTSDEADDAHHRAIARPMPREAPVMSAVR